MPANYGEGRTNAVRRLKREIEDASRDQECLQHLYATDPGDDKDRIEQNKGGLLEDSYHWILDNSGFQEWRNELQTRLLWVKGDPGKGKTMLLCGIIDDASEDRTVKIWDAGSGACLQTLEGHSDAVTSVTFSPDSTRLASASWDKTVKIWDAGSGACLQTLEGHGESVTSVAFSPDSTRLASASEDKTVKIWDTGSGACLQTLKGHSDAVTSVAFSPDLTRLASASRDKTVKIWDTGSGACLQTLKGHGKSVTSVAFSPDSTLLASASEDKTVKIWDAGSGACLQTLGTGEVLFQISFDATGLYLRTEIGTIAIDTSSAVSMRPSVTDSQKPRYRGLALSPDGVWITYNSDNLVRLPSEYRPSCSAVLGTTIGFGVGSGKVYICKYN
jgi:aspartate 1-decarboxylase